ncbi:pyruvate dehydrogenase phosphatase regulatory subunit, mitochondrial-like isoform X1 [Neodiprion pinetum]|uniref:Pyruvate dehydrogenase phosphatase regulatory subunit, mitochondrial isoform X1 n=2 Tax=Neodiprion lecontei TaxID=441921 RepID=A0A6J0B4V6_NEOLC|nr:pyruvate dehydrogenase phosphatase regulatory subunit, mitochondrial isoform X1 [Neodiprion lecontei]XP_046483885.1 pyruvate dehydrogenase phosphatase regulatory subunit, mitochondrial-like isoform X1 [Neodiprion pinetum]
MLMLNRGCARCLRLRHSGEPSHKLHGRLLQGITCKYGIAAGLVDTSREFRTDSSIPDSDSVLPSQVQVVIAGAGTVANSVAYHLVQNGWNDVLVLEQGRVGGGTSHFGSGTLGLFKPIAHRNIIMYSLKLYRQLHEMGFDIGMKECGSVNLAQTKDRMIALKRRIAYNVPTGLHCELLGKEELKKLHPYLHVDDLEGAVWVPEDAVADSSAICHALAKLAKQGGVRYKEDCRIEEVFTENGAVKSLTTAQGNIVCEYFINCAGMWARELGLRCNPPVRIPAYPAEHFYAVTPSLVPELSSHLPCVRDFDSHSYARQWQVGGLMVGWFEREAKPAFGKEGKVPVKDWHRHLKDDPQHWRPLWERAKHRLPILREMGDPTIYNSPDNFTPDGRWILGESPEVKNYFVAVGMSGNPLQGAGGIGKAVAEWMMKGEPAQELLPFNVQRFLDLHNNKQYLQQRIKEVVGRHYAILYPHQCEYKYARKLRCSPLYSVLEEQGAVFGIKMAYERPLYFDSTYRRGNKKPEMPPGSFYKPKFFDFMKEEFHACREGVGIIDMSSFSKIEIKSTHADTRRRAYGSFVDDGSSRSEVVNYLQLLCSNDANIPVGTIAHTGMQNERGGYENDCMLVRQMDNSFFMVSPTSQQTRIYQWMSRHLPADRSVGLNDVTSKYTVINIVGPKATELLSELSNSDINLSPFTHKKVNVGYASDVMVMAFTHTGEPGYCLYIPSEYALHVYARLMATGKDYGVRNVGVLTQRFMRIERFIPFWAEELSPHVTPYEAGNGYSVKLDKEYFIGKYALQHQKEQGVRKRLVLFVLGGQLDPNKDVWPWGGEPLYRDDRYVGTVTSAGYGFATDKLICLGFIGLPGHRHECDDRGPITTEFIMDPNARYEVDIAGRRFPAKPHVHPLSAPALNKVNKKYTPTPVLTCGSDILL